MLIRTLDDLEAKLRVALRHPNAQVQRAGDSLIMNSNQRSHQQGECVQVTDRGTTYSMHYMALFMPAKDTLLAPEHAEEIAVTPPLDSWATTLRARNAQSDTERYERGQFYGELISLSAEDLSLVQVSDACDFFVGRFNEKYCAQ